MGTDFLSHPTAEQSPGSSLLTLSLPWLSPIFFPGHRQGSSQEETRICPSVHLSLSDHVNPLSPIQHLPSPGPWLWVPGHQEPLH